MDVNNNKEKEEKKLSGKKKVAPKKAKHTFIREFKTTSKVYKKGDPCHQTDKNVIKFLITKKYIK